MATVHVHAFKSGMASRRFCLVLVKPSHYDDDGYVIQWLRSPIPSNSLASLYGLAKDCAERQILGDDVAIDIHAFDETNTRIRPHRIAAMIEEAGAGMVMLTGGGSGKRDAVTCTGSSTAGVVCAIAVSCSACARP